MFIQRDFKRIEEDDFKLNVLPKLNDTNEAVAQYYDGKIVGWKIQRRYE